MRPSHLIPLLKPASSVGRVRRTRAAPPQPTVATRGTSLCLRVYRGGSDAKLNLCVSHSIISTISTKYVNPPEQRRASTPLSLVLNTVSPRRLGVTRGGVGAFTSRVCHRGRDSEGKPNELSDTSLASLWQDEKQSSEVERGAAHLCQTLVVGICAACF